jgi:hypothetical protein
MTTSSRPPISIGRCSPSNPSSAKNSIIAGRRRVHIVGQIRQIAPDSELIECHPNRCKRCDAFDSLVKLCEMSCRCFHPCDIYHSSIPFHSANCEPNSTNIDRNSVHSEPEHQNQNHRPKFHRGSIPVNANDEVISAVIDHKTCKETNMTLTEDFGRRICC